MKQFLASLVLLVLLNSCGTAKRISLPPTNHFTDIAIEWQGTHLVNDIYVKMLDSVMNHIIYQFNQDGHSFTLHKRHGNEENKLLMVFERTNFVTKAEQTNGYIKNGLGLVASPLSVLAGSGGNGALAFWSFPKDKIWFSNTILYGSKKHFVQQGVLQSGALFEDVNLRLNNMGEKVATTMFDLLNKMDEQNKQQ